jgi:hydrogenase maturation protease
MSVTSESTGLWVIGYGNPQRRDDGSGCSVAARLDRLFGPESGVSIRTMHQLDPVLVEDLRDAEEVLFVDATVQPTPEGREWLRLCPDAEALPHESHHLGPGLLLGLIQRLYGRCPKGWLVSVQGEDFGFGEGLSREGRIRAKQVTREIASFMSRKLVDKRDEPVKSCKTQEKGDRTWP